MKKIILIYGLISGMIISAMIFITGAMYNYGTLSSGKGELIGYSTMVIALSLIFFGVKSYRDHHLQGNIKFGRALLVGISIAGVASLLYAISWEINLKQFMPDFMDQYSSMAIAKAKEGGKSAAEIQQVIDRINQTKEMYKNPFLRFTMTLVEIFPVGILIALVSAAILRKK